MIRRDAGRDCNPSHLSGLARVFLSGAATLENPLSVTLGWQIRGYI